MYPMGYGGYYGYGYDRTMLLIIPAILLTLYAQYKVTSTTNRFFRVRSDRGYTGEETARRILDSNGLFNVRIEMVRGRLSDHYDPRSKTINLSSDIYNGSSIASASVASHECGHAIQDKEGYLFLKIRSSIVPLVNFSSYAGYFAILIGLIFSLMDLVFIGIIFEVVILAFQIITLPVEFNASHRALVQLKQLDIVDSSEHSKCRGMLIAAALTYVASVATTILQILRYVLMFRRDDDR